LTYIQTKKLRSIPTSPILDVIHRCSIKDDIPKEYPNDLCRFDLPIVDSCIKMLSEDIIKTYPSDEMVNQRKRTDQLRFKFE
jgi:hypothetical protein